MTQLKRAAVIMALATTLMLVASTVAHAQASISLGGDAVITSSKVLSVPIIATCDPVGQETTFILVTVTQPRGGGTFVEGEGAIESVTCDSTPHTYNVTVPRTGPDPGAWRPGDALLTAIISYCFTENGSLNCTTQAFISQTTITLRRR
jgi:hypothetical protein